MAEVALLTHLGIAVSSEMMRMTWPHIPHHPSGYPRLIHMVELQEPPREASDGKPLGIFQLSPCIIFAIVPLAKASHVAKPRISVGGDNPRTWIQGGELL